MKRKEAYSTLEIPETSTAEEAKKAFRQLSKMFHPDNKDTGSEDKFKKINEAYQAINNNKFDDDAPQGWGGFNPFHQQQQFIQLDNISIHTTLSFKDAILGCKKELKFSRKTKCKTCNGAGEIKKNNGCTKCGGKGQTVVRQGFSVMISTCDKCFGRSQADPCNDCGTQGVVDGEASINVTVPGGVQSGNVLRIGGMGHFVGFFMGQMEQHTDVHLHIDVTPEEGLKLDGNHVVSNLEISLLEALRGCKKSVKTILGEKEVDIKPQSKNKDEVVIPRLGVNGIGNQRVILDVAYPNDVSKLIDVLANEG